MDNKKILNMLLGISGIYGYEFAYYDMLYNEKLLNYSVKLLLEIEELLDKGYSKEEVMNLIIESDFKKNNEINKEEEKLLKADAIRILDTRIKVRKKRKNK